MYSLYALHLNENYTSYKDKFNYLLKDVINYGVSKEDKLKEEIKRMNSIFKKVVKDGFNEKNVVDLSIRSNFINTYSKGVTKYYEDRKYMNILSEISDLADIYPEIFEFYLKVHLIKVQQFREWKDNYSELTPDQFKERYPNYPINLLIEAKMSNDEWISRDTKETLINFKSFIKKVEAKAGKIKSAKYLQTNEKGNIDGYLICEKGNLDIETIGAGGYNIQKYHFRTLMKLR